MDPMGLVNGTAFKQKNMMISLATHKPDKNG